MGEREYRALRAEHAARAAEYEARRAYNEARWRNRMRGIPDPDHDFTGAMRLDYEMLCLEGIHPLGEDRLTCSICGAWVVGWPVDMPTTDVSGTSTRFRGHNGR